MKPLKTSSRGLGGDFEKIEEALKVTYFEIIMCPPTTSTLKLKLKIDTD
jgi:hypothetical protein